MRKFLKISGFTLGLIAVAIIACIIAVQTPRVQTFMAKKAVGILENKFGGTIEFDKVQVHPFDALVLKNIVVKDNTPYQMEGMPAIDTILRARYLVATFSVKGLFKKEGLHIKRAYLTDAVFNLTNEPDGTNLTRFLNLQKKEDKKEQGNVFDVEQLEVQNLRFRLISYSGMIKDQKRELETGIPETHVKGTIDWDDLDVVVSCKGKGLTMSGGYMSGELLSAEIREKSGYHVNNLSAKAKVGHGKTLIENIQLIDNWSVLNVPELSFNYDNTRSWSNFIEEVRMKGTIEDSRADLRSLSYFAPALKGRNIILDVEEGKVEGYVNDLNIKKIKFSEQLSGVSGILKGSLTGLPDSQGMLTNIPTIDLKFTTDGIGKFIKGWAPDASVDLSNLAKGETFSFVGSGKGPLNRMCIKGVLSSRLGKVDADIDITNTIDPKRPIKITGYVETHDLNIGGFIGNDIVKECSLRTSMSAVLTPGSPSAQLDSVVIDRLSVLGYDYTGIAATGTYKDQSFDGRIICNDPNLNFLFQGLVNFSRTSKNAIYKFYANLGYADLNALNIDSRGTSKLSLQVNSNFMKVQSGDLIGSIDVAGLSFEDDLGRHNVGDISITSHSNEDVNRINFKSTFADGSFRGTKPFTQMIKDVKAVTVQRELSALSKDTNPAKEFDDYSVRFNFHDSRDILSLIKPGLYIADSTSVRFDMTRSGSVDANIKSRRIALGAKYLKDLNLQIDNNDGSLNGTMRSGEMSIGALDFKNNAFILYADNNKLGVGYSFDNETELSNKGELFITGQIERSAKDSLILSAQTLPSYVYYDGNPWNIRPAGFRIAGSDIGIDNLAIESYDQNIHIDGGISKAKADTLKLTLDKFNISLLNKVIGQDYGISGLATGKALLTSPTSTDMGLLLNMVCDSTYFGGQRAGRLNLASAWNEESNKFNIVARNDLDGRRTIDLSGDFFPKDKTLDVSLLLDGMNAGYAYPFLSSLFSEMSGTVHGAIHAYGPVSRLEIESHDAGFDQVSITVDYTKVKYTATGPVHLDSYGLHFDDLNVKDRFDGAGILSGAVTYDHLWNLGVDTHIKAEKLECLDLTEKDNEDFYGNIYATGQVDITGPLNAILLEANASTSKAGSFHIPMGSSASARNSDLLVFKEEERYIEIDPYEQMMSRMKETQKSGSDFWIKLKVQATQDVEAFIEVDKETGNVLNGRGNGTILVEVRPAKDIFSLNGDYNITSGNYHFNAMGLAQRDFAIQDGSSVRFNGDVMDSDLDINAIYSTKTSLSNLLTDSTSVSSRRTVECGIAITDKLSNPQIAFSINVPDLDPTTKSMVESALNTDDKIQKQFIYLLIANSFLPDEQSGIANNNSNMLYSNVAQMMANQLNNIMEKLDIPLDLGLNYQSDDKGQNLFDVAVSTQLFNNRVVVNGTLGSRQYNTSGTNDEMVGDLDIEVKLDKSGQVRFNLFSHSADDYTNYLDNTQRNGVGVTYQKEFNSFREILRNMFTSKKKRERRALEQLEAQQNEEMVTIKIEKEEKEEVEQEPEKVEEE